MNLVSEVGFGQVAEDLLHGIPVGMDSEGAINGDISEGLVK